MKHLKTQLQGAGFGNTSVLVASLLMLSIAGCFAIWVQLTFSIIGLSICSFLVCLGILFEALSIRAKFRSEAISKLWPEVIDSLVSGASSNLSLLDSMSDLALKGPKSLRPGFQGFVDRVDAGWQFEQALDWLKKQFGQVHADRLLELIRITKFSGGSGYINSLRRQGKITREEIALWSELEAKQGWVQGTAKLAVVAPWLIVAILGSRPENSNFFNSGEGLTLLFLGLAVSGFAYRLIQVLGRIARPVRVFAE